MSDNNSTANTIPAEWTKTLQGEICRLGNGEKSQVAGFPYFEVKYLRGQKPKTLVNEGRFVLKDNKVIIVDGENSGEVFTIPENGYMGSTCKVLEINPKIDEKFLLYFIASKKQLYRNKKKGSAIPHLDKKLFAEMPFAYPKLLSEQQRIVAKIEELFSKLDAGIESLKKAKKQLAVYRQAVLKEALNGKNAWGKIQADDCVEDEDYSLAIGPFGSDLKVDDYTESGVRLVFVRDVTSCFADKKNKFVSEIKANQLEAHNVFQGDLLITKMGDPPGQTAIYPFERGVITSDILRMKVNENIINKYFAMYYILSPEGKQQIKSMTQGVAQKKISLGRFKKFMFSVPELTEQSSIVSQIESRLSVCDQIERTVNESLEKADVLRQSILKKAFEGGL